MTDKISDEELEKIAKKVATKMQSSELMTGTAGYKCPKKFNCGQEYNCVAPHSCPGIYTRKLP